MNGTSYSTTERLPTVIATCPHCGCSIYSRENDERGLPVPEYICQCRFLAAVAGAPTPPGLPYYVEPAMPVQPSISPTWWPTVDINTNGTAVHWRSVLPVLTSGNRIDA
jgi:hypothetical protein